MTSAAKTGTGDHSGIFLTRSMQFAWSSGQSCCVLKYSSLISCHSAVLIHVFLLVFCCSVVCETSCCILMAVLLSLCSVE